jgi:CRISPR system Cascade subunit CasE
MSKRLHLIHLRPKLNRLLPWAQRQGLVADRGQGDLGYAFHCALHAAFGEIAPQPFNYRDGQGLLAYSAQVDALKVTATLATPEVADMLGLDESPRSPGLLVRPFPTEWKQGQCLSFEVRARPVIRAKDGRERDAYLSAVEHTPDNHPSREVVYVDWLKRQMTGVAQLHEIGMRGFQLTTVVRRSIQHPEGGRPRCLVRGPDVLFDGLLQVEDTAAFAALLARGIGRHRAFGFGMLLLKPAVSAKE